LNDMQHASRGCVLRAARHSPITCPCFGPTGAQKKTRPEPGLNGSLRRRRREGRLQVNHAQPVRLLPILRSHRLEPLEAPPVLPLELPVPLERPVLPVPVPDVAPPEPIEPVEPVALLPAPPVSEAELPVPLVPLPDMPDEPAPEPDIPELPLPVLEPDIPEPPLLVLDPVVPEPELPPVAPAPIPELPPLVPELAPVPELLVPERALSLPFAPPHAESANAIVIPAAMKIFFMI
jgi:hypothetical protein